LTTAKTQQFSETSSIFALDNIKKEAILRDRFFFSVDNIKDEAILRDFLQKWKVECRADGLVPMRFAIFPLHLSKLLRLPRKSDARSYEVLHLSRKIISANLKIHLMLQNAAPLRKSAPGPPKSSDEHVSCTAPATENASLHASSNVPRLPSFLEMPQNPHVLLTFDKVHNPLRLPRETTSERPKVVQPPGVFFHLLT